MTTPQKFRTLPVVIEAMRYDGSPETATPIIDWVMANHGTARFSCAQLDSGRGCGDKPHTVAIDTLEGTMHASPGDWIIRGVQGEFYPCKPEIFAATYEAATDAPFDAADELERLEWLVLSSDATNPQRLAYLQGVVTQRRASRPTEQVDRPSRVTASNWGVDVHPRATAAMRAADAAGVLEVAPDPRPRVIAEPTYSDLQGEPYEIGEVTCVACSWLQRGTLGMTCPACSAAFTKPESAE